MMSNEMRIQRALARAGVASRRGAERMIEQGRITVNGEAAHLGQVIDPATDRVSVDGKPVKLVTALTDNTGGVLPGIWIVLNKPAGVLTSKTDTRGRKTVFDLVDDIPGLTYVGRLDYMTEGVLLFTNNGDAVNTLTHPRNEIERTYVATVRGNAPEAVKLARRGVQLEDGMVFPRDIEARRIDRGLWELDVTIAEGRNREIRRLAKALDLVVERLVRTQFGPVKLGSLPSGVTRPLTKKESELIAAITKRV
jgi:23S rRNA pseudouridine2605 synthase